MDANGTRFQLVLGRSDWSMWHDGQGVRLVDVWAADKVGDVDSPAWTPETNAVTLAPRLPRLHIPSGIVPPTLLDRRGGARDRYGNWYWIAEGGREVRVWSNGSRRTSHFWSVGDGSTPPPQSALGTFQPLTSSAAAPSELRGVAITDDHYLVIGVVLPPGLLIFDLQTGRPPRQVVWPANVPFSPFDLAARPGGGVWVLDRAHARYWGLDRHFAVIPQGPTQAERRGDFRPRAGSTGQTSAVEHAFPSGISLHASSPLTASDPIAIEALPDGCSVLVLDSHPGQPFSLILRATPDGVVGAPVSTAEFARLIDAQDQADVDLSALDFALAPNTSDGSRLGRLYVLSVDGAQAFAFDATLDGAQLHLEPFEQYLPLRLFGGTGLVIADGQPFYDFDDRWIPLVDQQRPRYATCTLLESNLDAPLDGREPDCVWHRLMLDACVPHETRVEVFSRASNTIPGLVSAAWLREPDPVGRAGGSELPFVPAADRNSRWATWELLFQQTRGRYLQLRLRLWGNGRATPAIHSLRAYYPRFSYRDRYLPAAYRQDRQSASFVDRFLANFEGMYTSIEDRLAAAQVLFDSKAAPAETLDWLATWFGVSLDPTWEPYRKRLFISHAVDLFQYRGTLRGIEMGLRLAMDGQPDESIFLEACAGSTGIRLIEGFRTPDIGPSVNVADAGVWRDFLARRYNRIDALNAAYGQAWLTFDDVPLLAETPTHARALADWTQFTRVVVPSRRRAHRFSVLLPLAERTPVPRERQAARLALAQKLVDLEKPAHTVASVDFYWAIFRLGDVRLGEDTRLKTGSRAPELMPAMVLHETALAEAFLASSRPAQGADR